MLPGKIIPPDEVKVLLLDLITDLDGFCREHGFRYGLAYGSLIGAVRHKGFIPWDDDIDILMPRPDFVKLIQAYHHPYYEIRCQDIDPEYPLNFAKLCDTRTVSVDQYGNSSPIAVDIFILNGLGASLPEAESIIRRVKRMHRIWSNQLFTRKLHPSRAYGFKKNLYILLSKVINLFLPLDRLVKRILSYKQSHPIDGSKYCASLDGWFTIYETEKMLQYKDAPFEDRVLRIPDNYDYQLRVVFGDYMQLPPEDQRTATHEATAYWVQE